VSASAKLGKAMRRLRRERKLSQEDLADLAGLDRTFVSMLERGKRRATLESAESIASGFGLSLSELIASLE
jgi:transcriptional regulator with XRE-family HTH domain